MAIELFDMSTPLTNGNPRAGDIQAIESLWRLIDNDNPGHMDENPEMLRLLMSNLDYLVLRNDKQSVIGAVSIADCSKNKYGLNLAEIASLAVHPDYQRKRYGSKLAASAVHLCWEKGYQEIITTAMPSSKGIFERLGFKVYETYESGNASMLLERE